MLDRETRAAILSLRSRGHGIRKIARDLKIHRRSVKRVLEANTCDVPVYEREENLTPYLERLRALYVECDGNFVRVHEELVDELRKKDIGYSTLTAFCRRNGIGERQEKRSGEYTFGPGEEMQHDTSPHVVVVGGEKRNLQCAALVLSYSRMVFIQLYECFDRFTAKVFLTDALKYFGGSAGRCVIDNTSVIVARGSGKKAVMNAEMEAFGNRFSFEFMAHELGDPNRKARVERNFSYVERNFYPGRTFENLEDLNRQAIEWCDRANRKMKRSLRATPLELYQTERLELKRLPTYVPEVYRPFNRCVDPDGYVAVDSNRYSVPDEFIGRDVVARETKDKVTILIGHKVLAEHPKLGHKAKKTSRLPGHRKRGHWQRKRQTRLTEEEQTLRQVSPAIRNLVDALDDRYGNRRKTHTKKLFSMYVDFPTEPLERAISKALYHGLIDVGRIERIVLRNIAGNFFTLDDHDEQRKEWNEREPRPTAVQPQTYDDEGDY